MENGHTQLEEYPLQDKLAGQIPLQRKILRE